jgi:tetratricopeptide (TPR) repeat protein
MEVAVSRFGSIVRSIGQLVLSLVVLVAATGCADMMTYSQDAQREGLKLYRQGDYANAAGAFRNSVRQNPKNYQSYFYLATCYDQMGQYQQAIAEFKTAQKTQAVSIEGQYDDEMREKITLGLAGSIAKSDQRSIEMDSLQKQAESHNNAQDWFVLAKALELRGDADSSLDAYNRAALLEPKNFLIQKNYGLLLAKCGQNEKAFVPLRTAYSLNNTDEQVVAGLRQIGVVPGPSLMDENQLARPLIPKGPIPSANVPGVYPTSPTGGASGSTAAAPRD